MIGGRKVRFALPTPIALSLMFLDQPPLPSVLLHHHHDFAPTLGHERVCRGADPPRAPWHPLDPRRVRIQAPASSPRRRSVLHEPRSAFPAARSPLRERCRWQDDGRQGQHARGGTVEGGTGAAPRRLDSGRLKTSRGVRLQSVMCTIFLIAVSQLPVCMSARHVSARHVAHVSRLVRPVLLFTVVHGARRLRVVCIVIMNEGR